MRNRCNSNELSHFGAFGTRIAQLPIGRDIIEIILTAITGFILGAVFVRLWGRMTTREQFDKCLDEIARKNQP
ncbi:MAG: hypothetical protein GTO12_06515 [Proteobacteria bacterium]|nr:hypothetical protein [Pseudomonadota bacterium]